MNCITEHIYGIDYNTPDIPAYNKITGCTLVTRNQKFRRTEVPQSFEELEYDDDGEPVYTPDQEEFINNEVRRIDDGYWFFSNGVITYITGLHYFYLNYWVLEDGNPVKYRDADRKWFYFQDYCESKPYIYGILRGKFRRQGATSQACAALVRTAMRQRRAFNGIVSKTGDDARDAFRDMVMTAIRTMPMYIKPWIDNEEALTEVNFVKKATSKQRATKKKGQTAYQYRGLESKIQYKNTSLNAFDSGRKTMLLIDECFAPGTKILCEGMEFRNIEDIRVGDKVIVEGGKLMRVGKTREGYDEMYLIEQPYGVNYIVNSAHQLYLQKRGYKYGGNGIISESPVRFLKRNKSERRHIYSIKSAGIEFDITNTLPLDPYLLGAWLGDGDTGGPQITLNISDDKDFIDELKNRCNASKLVWKLTNCNDKKSIARFRIGFGSGKRSNEFTALLRRLHVLNNKHIPTEYLVASRESRLELLSALIDTDGCYRRDGGCYVIEMINKRLVEEIRILALSLGFSCSIVRKKTIFKFNRDCITFVVSFNPGNIRVPCKIRRKINEIDRGTNKRCSLRVTPIGTGKYHGIQLISTNDQNSRLILEDFTLTFNCGKWEEVPIHVYWGIVKKTMGQGAVRVGFCLMPTTVNKAKKGGENFKILWDSSDHNKHTTTPTGLYRYFCPADDGFEPFIDDYGMSIRGELTPTQKTSICTITGTEWWDAGGRTCADYIKYKTKQIDDDETRQEEIRMLPLSEAKMFEFGAVEAFLNTHNIHAQKDYLVHHLPTFRQIRFVRKDDGVVDFADDTAGPWKVLMLPKSGEINRSGFGDDGFKRPANTATYTISVDPMRNSGEAKYGSKGAAWVIKKPDATDPENSNMPVAMYLGRPRWKKHFYEQLFLAAEYYGCKINYESDIKDAEDYAFENGLKGYLRKRPKSTISPDRKFDEKFKKQYGTPSNDPFSFSKQLELLKVYFDSYCHLIYFYELLEDAEKFDPEDRTKRDLTVAFGIGLTDCVADVRPKSGANIKKIKLIRTFDLSKNGHL